METTTINTLDLVAIDQKCIWHPFTQMQTAPPPIPIIRGKGVYLYSVDGKAYLDAISSWWVNLHVHAHPYIAEKIKAQLDILEHVIFADFTHPPAIELAARLLALLPGNQAKIFYTDNGSTAVETAIKMALQYWYNKNPETKKTKVICFKNSYHGDTFGAMSAAGKNPFHKAFWRHLFEVEQISPPTVGNEQESLDQLSAILNLETACFIFEPLILGVGGMIIYPPAGLDALLKLCHERNVLTIADEVMTGFGRTGPLFACELLTEQPDIICLSKGLSGGFLPLGATSCKQHIFDAFLSDSAHNALLHGHSYTGNPLACVSALASLDLLEKEECSAQRKMIANSHEIFCAKWKTHPKLKRCESIGTILVLEYAADGDTSYFQPIGKKLYRYFLEQEILLRPFGNVLHMMPPYCIQEEELQIIYQKIINTLENTI
jgi:adenosylmethionine-8-amino-7-oxononanoate aminotransferase